VYAMGMTTYTEIETHDSYHPVYTPNEEAMRYVPEQWVDDTLELEYRDWWTPIVLSDDYDMEDLYKNPF